MKLKIYLLLFFIAILIISKSYANSNHRVDGHAPIGVTRDHIHKKGEIMASYRVSYAKMKGLRNGDDNVTTTDVLNEYNMAPQQMVMKMHMLGIMYGITDKFTMSTMGSLIEKEMDLINLMNVESQSQTDGIGDAKINLSYGFLEEDYGRSQLNLALSLPTGNIDKKYNGRRLAYPMQIGSGSYELRPGISYSGYEDNFSYGGQVNGIFRLNSNDNGYKLGDSYNITSWIARKLNHSFSISTRLDYNKNEAIEGYDSALNPSMMPGANSSIHDRERLDLLFGVNFMMPSGFLKGNRLAIEFGKPIYERVDGPLLKSDYKVTIGWQNTF
ncbi:hypothetical protein N9X24_00485 [Rickettsiales bacterium]|nr:hypothetical protein [Rickettsiales bacterium]